NRGVRSAGNREPFGWNPESRPIKPLHTSFPRAGIRIYWYGEAGHARRTMRFGNRRSLLHETISRSRIQLGLESPNTYRVLPSHARAARTAVKRTKFSNR